MLVHAVTAPTAVLRTLPELDQALWAPNLTAAWSATAAITAVYGPMVAATSPVEGWSVDWLAVGRGGRQTATIRRSRISSAYG